MSDDRQLEEALEAVRAQHVDAAGACDFRSLVASREHGRLAAALSSLVSFDPRKLRVPFQTAFWLNVYNACVLRDALELEIDDFFLRPRAHVAGTRWSLDDIEHGLLRGNVPKFGSRRTPMQRDDPRLVYMPLAYDERTHFAMYSASHSSPPFRIFDAGKLDAQFEDATAEYLQRHVRVESQGALVVLPRLFYWYGDDFGGEQGALEFALGRLDEDTVDLVDRRRGRVKVRYAPFDWTLNRRG